MNTDHAGHVDDRTLALAHHDWCASVDEIESRFQVNGNHGIPLLFAHAHHEAVFCDTGIVHQDVDRAEVSVYFFHHFSCLSEVSSVRSIADALNALSFDFLACCFAVFVDDEVGEGNVCTLFCEFQGDGLANAAGGTCNQCGFTC